MTDDDWTHTLASASRSEARRLLAQIEADERYGVYKVMELFDSFEVRSLAQISQEQMADLIILCRRVLEERGI